MINFQFVSEALPEDTFQVLQFDAEEEVSQLFHVELRLVSRDPNIDFDLMLKRAARLSIITEGKKRNIHGMLAEFEQGGEWQNGLYEYRALLVPRLWMLSQSTQNQIFQDQTVLDIVESELKNVNKKGSNPLSEAGLGSDADYEAFTIRRYEEREYVVQYKETDLNFISRLMEHEGLYYYFEHNDDCEKLVITDTFAEEHISDNSEALFQSEASGVRYDNRVVYKLSRMQKQIPSSVLVKDFNYRSPSLPMQAMGDIDESGIGFVTEFGAHFKSPEEGEALATVRAEEFKCRQNTYSGESNISDFSCGHVYSLSQHFRSDYNQSYMLTKVKHQGSQEIESWGNIGSTKYSNQFDCIPALLQFRPQRLAIKPRLFGIMNGVIDSEQDLGRADLDEQGRYKVQMPFDISGVAPGMASRRIRMAQSYGGAGDDGGGIGMSFPLLKGTEVIWTCIDGDIDRPIITGVVPNPLQPSPTNTQNANSNVIRTTSGISMSFNDGSGRDAGQNTTGGGAGGGLDAQQQFQSITSSVVENPLQQSLQQQRQMSDDLNSAYSSAGIAHNFTGTGKNFVIVVPDYEEDGNSGDSKDSYFRMGMPADGEASLSSKMHFDKPGITSYTDGDYVSIVKGQTYTHHTANSSTITKGTKYSYGISRTLAYSMSNNFTSSIGINASSKAGMDFNTNTGVTVDMKAGAEFKFGLGASFSFYQGKNVEVQKEKVIEVDNVFSVKVDPDDAAGGLEDIMENKVPLRAALFAAGSTAFSATLNAVAAASADADGTEGLNIAAETQAALTYAYGTWLTVQALRYASMKGGTKKGDSPAARLQLDVKDGIMEVAGREKVSLTPTKKLRIQVKDKPGDALDAAVNTRMTMERSDGKGEINIDAGVGDDNTGDIIIKNGKSSIRLKKDCIVFDTPYINFATGSKAHGSRDSQVQIGEGLWVMEKGLNVLKGDMWVKGEVVGNEVKAKSISGSHEAVDKAASLGSAKAAPK
jgi:type VI secretion system VgrG family protein